VSERRLSRRALLGLAGAAGGGLLVGGYVVRERDGEDDASASPSAATVPFHGDHQAGIATPSQKYLQFSSYDLDAGDAAGLRDLLRAWSDLAAELAAGRHTEAFAPASLTITFGLGPSVFDERFGLRQQRPSALVDIPPFEHDQLDPARCNGDLAVQVCSDDQHTALTAARALRATAEGAAHLRWSRAGFQRDPLPGEEGGTPRNLVGFKDGTANIDRTDDARMGSNVWAAAEDGAEWMAGGTYLVAREVEIDVDGFLAHPLDEQEVTFGRYKASGAPIGQKKEFDPVIPDLQPVSAHIIVANPHQAGSEAERILRRGYNYSLGFDPEINQVAGGLFFIAFQRDPLTQFIPIQRRLAHGDRMQHHLYPHGSAIFAVPPGIAAGGYVGETLLG